jgi:hypothetical protein
VRGRLVGLEEEELQWQNSQNRNWFKGEEGLNGHFSSVVAFVGVCKRASRQVLQSMVDSSYCIQSGNCSITKRHFPAVWTEAGSAAGLLGKLEAELGQFVTYDTNHRQYTIRVYRCDET